MRRSAALGAAIAVTAVAAPIANAVTTAPAARVSDATLRAKLVRAMHIYINERAAQGQEDLIVIRANVSADYATTASGSRGKSLLLSAISGGVKFEGDRLALAQALLNQAPTGTLLILSGRVASDRRVAKRLFNEAAVALGSSWRITGG